MEDIIRKDIYFPKTFKEFMRKYCVTILKRQYIEVDILAEGVKHYFVVFRKEDFNGEQSKQD